MHNKVIKRMHHKVRKWKKLYSCPKCGHKYEYPETKPMGFTFWSCPACDAEDGVHVSAPIEAMFSKEELAEIELKRNTYCSIKIVYSDIGDIPKFKKYKPELLELGNRELISQLSSNGGLVVDNISLIEAENIKREAEALNLAVEIYA